MSTLATLSSWIESSLADPAPFPREALPASLAPLGRHHGFFRDCGQASTIDCPACDDPHPCPVRRKSQREFEYYCDRRRWRPIDRAAVEMVQFSRPHLIAALATAAGCAWSPHQDAHGSFVRLGEINTASGKNTWTLAYADGLEAEEKVAVLIQTLKRMKPGGLVMTPSRVSALLPLPKKFVIAPLNCVFRIDGRALTFDVSAALELLGEHADTTGKAGRKTPIAVEKDLWIQHHRAADWPFESFTAQAAFILARWPRGRDVPKANKPETVAGHISAHRKAWAVEAMSTPDPTPR